MQICQDHWDMLRQEVADQGLADWIAPDGETAVEQLVNNLERGEDILAAIRPVVDAAEQTTTTNEKD